MVKNLPATWETWVRSLDWEDPLEEGMATHFSILAWKIPKDRGAWQATVYEVTRAEHDLVTKHSPHHNAKQNMIHDGKGGARNFQV